MAREGGQRNAADVASDIFQGDTDKVAAALDLGRSRGLHDHQIATALEPFAQHLQTARANGGVKITGFIQPLTENAIRNAAARSTGGSTPTEAAPTTGGKGRRRR